MSKKDTDTDVDTGLTLIRGTRIQRRAAAVVQAAELIRETEERHERTEALVLARVMALAGLPKKRARGQRDLTRTLRLGHHSWVRVTYSANVGTELPYGEDRIVLAAIQHLAIANQSPLIHFQRVGELLKMFGISQATQSYRLLRQRFDRINGLSIHLNFAPTRAKLDDVNQGEQSFVISRFSLPTRNELRDERNGQLSLSAQLDKPSPYWVRLDANFFEHLADSSNHLLIPLHLARHFVDRPTGYDYLLFLIARCGRARSISVIDHDVLLELFGDGVEEERAVIRRLLKYHQEIMLATGGRLNAQLVEHGTFPSTARGRRRKRWILRVGPSQPLVFSGRSPVLLLGP